MEEESKETTGAKVTREPGKGEGIEVKATKGEIAPPLGKKGEEETGKEEEITRKVTEKIPISSAIIKPPFRLEGNVLAEATGWPGWIYSEEDLEELTKLIQECGVMLAPQIQIVIAILSLHGAKFTGYMAWKKSGKKGDLRKQTGEIEKKKVPEDEEVRA